MGTFSKNQSGEQYYPLIVTKILAIGFVTYVLGFFLFTDTSQHRVQFYAGVLIPWLLLTFLRKEKEHRFGKLLQACAILLIYLFCSQILVDSSLDALFFYGKRALFIYCFVATAAIVTIKYLELKNVVFNMFLSVVFLYIVLILLGYFFPETFHGWLSSLGINGYAGGALVSWNEPSGFHLDHKVFPRLAMGGNQLDNPNKAALILGFSVLLIVGVYRESSTKMKWIYLGISIPIVSGLILTQSRGGLIGLVVVLPILMFRVRPKLRTVVLTSIALSAIGILLSYFGIVELIFPRGFSIGFRRGIYEQCLREGAESPLFGLGVRENVVVQRITWLRTISIFNFDHCHSAFLDTYHRSGVVGLFLCFSLLYYSFKSVMSEGRARRFWGGVLAYGLICINADGTFLLTRPDVYWLVFWLPIGVIAGMELREGKTFERDKLVCSL